jgi:peptide/nickel transport system permease protein
VSAPVVGEPATAAPARVATRSGLRSSTAVGAAILAAVAAAALLAPWLAPADPLRQDLARSLAPPSAAHPLGCDALGRDVLSRLVYGARTSLAVSAAAVAASVAVGAAVGALAGAFGPAADQLLMRFTDGVLAFPGILLAVVLAAILGPSERSTVIALAAMGWPSYARLVRVEVQAAAATEYALAARALGAPPWRLVLRHLLPAARPALLVQASFGLSGAIVAEASLAFLGLGAPPPAPSWGAMLAEGRSFLVVAPTLIAAPVLALLATIVAVNLIADGLRAAAGLRDGGSAQRWQRAQ